MNSVINAYKVKRTKIVSEFFRLKKNAANNAITSDEVEDKNTLKINHLDVKSSSKLLSKMEDNDDIDFKRNEALLK